MLKKNIANIVTVLRIIGTLSLLFMVPRSPVWLWVYGLCGVTDVLDGFLARRLKIQSRFGSRLDSASDLLFYAVMIIQLLPLLVQILPFYIWYIVGGVCFIRIVDYAYTAIRFRHLAATHDILNKISGFLVFLIPFTMELGRPFDYYAFSLVSVTAVAAIHELNYHIHMKPQDRNHA